MKGLLLLLYSILFLFLFFRSVQQHRQTLVPSFILLSGCLVTSGHRVPTFFFFFKYFLIKAFLTFTYKIEIKKRKKKHTHTHTHTHIYI